MKEFLGNCLSKSSHFNNPQTANSLTTEKPDTGYLSTGLVQTFAILLNFPRWFQPFYSRKCHSRSTVQDSRNLLAPNDNPRRWTGHFSHHALTPRWLDEFSTSNWPNGISYHHHHPKFLSILVTSYLILRDKEIVLTGVYSCVQEYRKLYLQVRFPEWNADTTIKSFHFITSSCDFTDPQLIWKVVEVIAQLIFYQ